MTYIHVGKAAQVCVRETGIRHRVVCMLVNAAVYPLQNLTDRNTVMLLFIYCRICYTAADLLQKLTVQKIVRLLFI
jgi:hypothetical protein